jgi:hypothetical protein
MLKQLLAILLIATIVHVEALAQTSGEPAAQAGAFAAALPRSPEKPNEAQIIKPGVASIPAGTTLEFALVQPLSSTAAKAGDDVALRLLRPLVAGDQTLLAEGTLIHGRVKKVDKAGPNCSNAYISWSVDHLSFSDHSRVRTSTGFITSDERESIPYETSLSPGLSVAGRVVEIIIMLPLAALGAAMLLVALPFIYLFKYSENRHHAPATSTCTAQGKEFNLPASTRVALVVQKRHTVRF